MQSHFNGPVTPVWCTYSQVAIVVHPLATNTHLQLARVCNWQQRLSPQWTEKMSMHMRHMSAKYQTTSPCDPVSIHHLIETCPILSTFILGTTPMSHPSREPTATAAVPRNAVAAKHCRSEDIVVQSTLAHSRIQDPK